MLLLTRIPLLLWVAFLVAVYVCLGKGWFIVAIVSIALALIGG